MIFILLSSLVMAPFFATADRPQIFLLALQLAPHAPRTNAQLRAENLTAAHLEAGDAVGAGVGTVHTPVGSTDSVAIAAPANTQQQGTGASGSLNMSVVDAARTGRDLGRLDSLEYYALRTNTIEIVRDGQFHKIVFPLPPLSRFLTYSSQEEVVCVCVCMCVCVCVCVAERLSRVMHFGRNLVDRHELIWDSSSTRRSPTSRDGKWPTSFVAQRSGCSL